MPQPVCSQQSVFCLWEMRWAKPLPLCLQCAFSASFAPVSASDAHTAFRPYRYEFQLDRVSVRILKTQLWVPIIRHHMDVKHHFFCFPLQNE